MAVSDSQTSLRTCCSNGTPGLSFFALAAVQGGADLAQQTLHATDGKVQVDRESCAQMLDHLITFAGLVLEKELIEDDR
jgi:hypothetical protein